MTDELDDDELADMAFNVARGHDTG